MLFSFNQVERYILIFKFYCLRGLTSKNYSIMLYCLRLNSLTLPLVINKINFDCLTLHLTIRSLTIQQICFFLVSAFRPIGFVVDPIELRHLK